MRLDALARLIESADPSSFREIALLCLAGRGFAPQLRDGPGDAGADFAVYLNPPSPTPFAVQISVEKDWRSKLRTDALKVRQTLGLGDLLFISSRRVPEAEFQDLRDELSRQHQIQVQRMDSQGIASLALRQGTTTQILSALGISLPQPGPHPFSRPDMRKDVAYACAFFAADAQTFRKAATEQAVLTVLGSRGASAGREEVQAEVALALGLLPNQRGQIAAAMDRMLQDGRLHRDNGSVSASPTTVDTWRALRALREQNRDELRRAVDALLTPMVPAAPRRRIAVDAIMEDLGALVLATATSASRALDAGDAPGIGLPAVGQEGLKDRLRHLEATLDTIGLAEGPARAQILPALAHSAAESTFGKTLAAGELFLNLLKLRTSHLIRALSERQEMDVVLDASVAIPLLCCLLYEPARQQFFLAARHLYDQLSAHGVPLWLPDCYLEEMATHLIEAQRYAEVVELDPDLHMSSNAFVAHYVALRSSQAGGQPLDFGRYLAGFDFSADQSDFYAVRDRLMRRLQGLLQRYHIRCERIAPREAALRRAEESVTFLQRQQSGLERPRVLLQHDIRMVAWLDEHDGDSQGHVLCTWDRLHQAVRQGHPGRWDVLDPAVLGDVLSLAAPQEDQAPVVSPTVVALMLTNAAAERGAQIWDFLLRTERDRIHDAELRAQAAAFKQKWLREIEQDPRARDVQRAWEEWKGRHLRHRADLLAPSDAEDEPGGPRPT